MEIPKDTIIEMITSRGGQDQAAQAGRDLPDTVDTARDHGLLAKFGIDPTDLIGGLGSKFGG